MSVQTGTNLTNGFTLHDTDETGLVYYYYGYLNEHGVSLVSRMTVAVPQVIRYSVGTDYDTHWAARATRGYKKVNEL